MPPEGWLLAAIGGLSTVIGVLWRDHLRADASDRAQRDQALIGWREQTAATDRGTATVAKLGATVDKLAATIEAKDRAAAERRRLAD